MRALAVVVYLIGLVIEFSGAVLVIRQARGAQRRDTSHGVEPGSNLDRLTRYRDVSRLRGDMEDIRSEQRSQIPSRLAIGLLLGGIVFGYLGNFLSLAA